MIQDLGDWAEDSFSRMCSRAGVTRNKSIQDRTGWDYLVEFPAFTSSGTPADLHPGDTTARVQIKSKKSGRPTISLKLSNALRFAKDPLPCFIVLFLATDGNEPVRIFARHFWDFEIAKALKRTRQAHSEEREDLHNLTISLTFSANDEKTDLISWMSDTIKDLGSQYTVQKARLSETLGFEEGAIHGSIQFHAEDIEALIDHQIGLRAEAPSVKISVRQRRFGIDARTPLFTGTPDFVRMATHPLPCRLRIRGQRRQNVWMDGQLFLPSLPNLPLELCKLRVVADFVEIIVNGRSEGKVTFHLDGNTQRSLSNLRAMADILQDAAAGPIQIQITSEGKPNFPFTVTVPVERRGDELQQLSYVINCLERASEGLLPADLTLSLTEIDDAWNAVAEFNGMIAGKDMKARFTLAENLPNEAGEPAGLYLYDFVDIGAWTFMAVTYRPVEHFELVSTEGSLAFGDASVVEAIVRRGAGADHLNELLILYHQSVKMAVEPVLELYGGSYREMRTRVEETAVLLHTPD